MKLKALIVLLRPHQWLKNLILFFPPFLGGKLMNVTVAGEVLWLAPLSFCLASSAAYIVNDLCDVEADRKHPQKFRRPIPAGEVTRSSAVILAFCCFVGAFSSAFVVGGLFSLLLLIYLVISLSYSAGLKHLAIVDIFCISSGFVVRLFAGGIAFHVVISDWLFLSVFLLALFLSAGKRLAETQELGVNCGEHRRVLKDYPAGTLELFMVISAATVLVTYTMYVITKHHLVYTVPLCCFGLFRYMINVKRGGSGDPTDALLKDPLLFAVGGAWALLVFLSLYVQR